MKEINEKEKIYVYVRILQHTLPPIIGVCRDKNIIPKLIAPNIEHYYTVWDPTDHILKGEKTLCFDDRNYLYPELLEIIHGKNAQKNKINKEIDVIGITQNGEIIKHNDLNKLQKENNEQTNINTQNIGGFTISDKTLKYNP